MVQTPRPIFFCFFPEIFSVITIRQIMQGLEGLGTVRYYIAVYFKTSHSIVDCGFSVRNIRGSRVLCLCMWHVLFISQPPLPMYARLTSRLYFVSNLPSPTLSFSRD